MNSINIVPVSTVGRWETTLYWKTWERLGGGGGSTMAKVVPAFCLLLRFRDSELLR